MEIEVEDRLSSLPDALLLEILTLLPISTAIATSVLSQRWRHLWTHLSAFRFPPDAFPNPEKHNVLDILDHIITRHLASTHIHTFHLHIPQLKPPTSLFDTWSRRLRNWVGLICSRGVKDIEVKVWGYPFVELIELPPCVFQCPSLVTLDFNYGFSFNLISGGINVNLPNLKRLSLCLPVSDCEFMGKLLRGCNSLQDFSLTVKLDDVDDEVEVNIAVDIFGLNLKRLSLCLWCLGSHQVSFNIDAPNLEYFRVSDGSEKLRYKFVKPLSGLVEADLNLGVFGSRWDEYAYATLGILQGVSSAKKLSLGGPILNGVSYLDSDGMMPVYHCLTSLTTAIPAKWTNLIQLLERAPNLEVLALKPRYAGARTMHSNTIDITFDIVPACLATKVNWVSLSELHGNETDLKLIDYLLKNANVLEMLDISLYISQGHSKEKQLRKEMKFCKGLSRLSGFNPTCYIRFSGLYITMSGDEIKVKKLT